MKQFRVYASSLVQYRAVSSEAESLEEANIKVDDHNDSVEW